MKGKSIDIEELLNDMIDDFEAEPEVEPSAAIIYKSMIFGAVKFAVKAELIRKPLGEEMQQRLEEICEKKKGEWLCQE